MGSFRPSSSTGWVRFVRLLVLLPVGLPAEAAFWPWFTDNMVLQQTTPSTKPGDLLLSGWVEKGSVVTVEFVGITKPISATLGPIRNQPNVRNWVVTYGDLKRNLAPTAPFTLAVITKNKKRLDRSELTNVVVGDVWVFGQKSDHGVPVPADKMQRLCGKAEGRVRYLPARSVDWSDVTHAVGQPWRPWDDSPATLTNLANVPCYFAGNLTALNRGVPVGIIAAPWEALIREAFVTPDSTLKSDLKQAWEAASNAASQAASDYEPVKKKLNQEILRLKFEGRVFPEPVPPEIEIPTRLHPNNFRSLPCAVRGGLW